MKKYFWIVAMCVSFSSFSQNNKQYIRGVVIDKLSQMPLASATLELIGSDGKKTAQSDAKGNYTFTDVAPGSYDISISFIGYKLLIIPNVTVTSGKEVIQEITLEDEYKHLKEVVVTGSNKAGTINKFATVSGRTFSMEEVNRYAGGRSDPARLAANFAGVSAPDDSRNDIVIRGNSPVGVLWKIDGMNVSNPNHFASVGTTGGAVSALNTNLLKSSDFFTSAFPAEYGNAISGVFDLGFRNGNATKRETTLQFGVITGLEATTEGPIKKGSDASYLFGYRYSLAGLAQSVGIDIGTTSTPVYQDLSFKINSGTSRFGKFSMFGILASSVISLNKSSSNSLYGNGNQTDFSSAIGIIGVNHFKQINSKSFLSSTIGLNYSKTNQTNYDFDRQANLSYEKEENKYTKTGYNFNSSYNTKINSRVFLKFGIQDELIGLNLFDKTQMNYNAGFKQVWDYISTTNLAQAFAETKYSISERVTFNAGLHVQQLFLNNSTSLEPRIGIKYDLTNRSSFSFGYGLHSQMQPINMYFLRTYDSDGSYAYTNKNLDFTKSHQLVLGYNFQPTKDWRLKTEVYYQSLYHVPINTYSSSYSMLNTGSSFQADTTSNLVNKGTGTNTGIEFTVEKFFSKGYYGLFTSSIYDSKYTGSDGVERNTAFNGKYVYNILAGKEWKVGNEKRNKVSIDFKFTNAGGRYYTPIDLAASQAIKHQVQSSDAYSSRYSNYFRMDIKGGFTFNSSRKKLSQSISLDLQNVTNHQNIFSETYDNMKQDIKTTYQLGLFPNLVYRVQL